MNVSPCILVVDNDIYIREFIVGALNDEGFEAYTASSSRKAFGLLTSTQPHLLLMDVNRVTSDDLALVSAYRDQFGDDAIVVVMTTASHPDTITAQVPADVVLSKPFNLNDLLDIVVRYKQPIPLSSNTVG